MPIGVFVAAALLLTVTLFFLKRLSSVLLTLYQVGCIAFFFVHVEVAFQILTAFDCVDFMGARVHTDDLTRMCFSQSDSSSGDHLKFILSIALPFAILWLVIAPGLQIILSRLQKRNIKKLIECRWTISNLTINE